MIKEAIILAGGLGTRLRAAVPELPKCMAPVLAKPFIGYVVDYLYSQGVLRFVFALGYKASMLEQYLNTQYSNLDIVFSEEKDPLGTGGAVRLACGLVKATTVFVVNGDTFFKADLPRLVAFHGEQNADCTLALKPMRSNSRYSPVELADNGRITAFNANTAATYSLVNGGVYVLQTVQFVQEPLPEKFSFEKDYLEKYCTQSKLSGLMQDEYFIDIGVPEDYERAQTELIMHL